MLPERAVYKFFSTPHTREAGENYFEHMAFAAKIGFKLLASALIFITHAVVPAIKIPRRLNLIYLGLWITGQANERLNARKDTDLLAK